MKHRKWIKGALKYHRAGTLHRQLGVPLGQKIPRGLLLWAATRPGKLGRRARLALTLRRLGKRKRR